MNILSAFIIMQISNLNIDGNLKNFVLNIIFLLRAKYCAGKIFRLIEKHFYFVTFSKATVSSFMDILDTLYP